ncbi:MAG: serine hydrolase [Vicinamibacterales bacterium]|nr:hypothetical protein [Acidobacteriota bacterium]MDP6371545.1 serine hydrolase [Vicinamibacterales bacterium]MBU21993.1 hypothetical protein [Acidobacteriota bacterium]MDP6609291.1 serine hydrolase [Vicinamibacterales bacterium]MDP7338662.1 serine hydrolase [Vicinamibacterales bacterium]
MIIDLLGRGALEAALTPAMLGSGEPAGYGQDWRLSEQPDGRVIAQHGGSTNGFLATCTFSTTQNDTTVVMLSNVVSGDYADVRTAVFNIAWGEED